MMIILFLFVVVGCLIGSYYFVLYIIGLWTGCSHDEAVLKLHSFITGEPIRTLENDQNFVEQVWDVIRKIIGEKRFQQLINLSQTYIYPPLLYFGESGGIPFIRITINCEESEKSVLENVLVNLIVRFLNYNGYYTWVHTSWNTRQDILLYYITIYYARNPKEFDLLRMLLNDSRKKIIDSNSELTDDEEEVDLL